jgi:hypothetical protein
VGNDDNIIRGRFPGDDVSESVALEKWHEIYAYLVEQALVAAFRGSEQPSAPWPAKGNPMLGYIIDRAREIVDADGVDAALVWLGVHAWFEGGVADRARSVRWLIDDERRTPADGR